MRVAGVADGGGGEGVTSRTPLRIPALPDVSSLTISHCHSLTISGFFFLQQCDGRRSLLVLTETQGRDWTQNGVQCWGRGCRWSHYVRVIIRNWTLDGYSDFPIFLCDRYSSW